MPVSLDDEDATNNASAKISPIAVKRKASGSNVLSNALAEEESSSSSADGHAEEDDYDSEQCAICLSAVENRVRLLYANSCSKLMSGVRLGRLATLRA